MLESTVCNLQHLSLTFVARLAPALRDLNQAIWDMNTLGTPEAVSRVQRLSVQRMELFTNPADWQQLQTWYGSRELIADALLRRQIEVLYLEFAANQRSAAEIAEIAARESELEATFANFRSVIGGAALSDNQVLEILTTAADSATVAEAWSASKQIGPLVAPQLLDLVRLRNRIAQRQGYPDFYTQELLLQEIEPAGLSAILDEVEAITAAPFAAAKAALDQRLAARFGVDPAELRPWHYGDPFFQSPPPSDSQALDAVYADCDIVELSLQSFAAQGLEVGDIVESSDLFERPSKNQHAFCTQIDRDRNDVRVLCNLRPTARWMDTMLHELGHAVYDKYIPASLPFVLRTIAHISTTEAVAMLMGRQARSDQWLAKIRQLAPAEARAVAAEARADQRLGMLVFARWVLVMAHFERALYADPDRADLNGLWWELVERFQGLQRPPGRDQPDWAAKIHFTIAPVYYHNYLLGELTASQLERYIEAQLPGEGVAGNPAVGPFLAERLFALGARYPWNETLAQVTGEPLSARHFVAQFVD